MRPSIPPRHHRLGRDVCRTPGPPVEPVDASQRPQLWGRAGGIRFQHHRTADIPIVVEACTNLASANWVPLQSLNLTNGAFYFNDPNWTNYPARNYRIRSP